MDSVKRFLIFSFYFMMLVCHYSLFDTYRTLQRHINMKIAMDIIFLGQLEIETIIGIYDWERETKQKILLDIDMAFDIRKAAQTDDIAHTLNYKTVSKRIISFVENSHFFLVETLISEIATIILDEFHVPWVRITLNKKGAIRGASDVGIIIERGEK